MPPSRSFDPCTSCVPAVSRMHACSPWPFVGRRLLRRTGGAG
jgi:hypothetical protein